MKKPRILMIMALALTVILVACSGFEEKRAISPEGQDQAENQVGEEQRVSVYGVGDNLIHSPIYQSAHIEGNNFDFTPVYEFVKEDISAADIAIVNQESPIAGDEIPFSGYPMFNTPEDMREAVIDTGFDVVLGANNHTMDNGTFGVENTMKLWEEYEDQVDFTGVFESQEDRDNFLILEENGIRIAVLTYTYGLNGLEADEPYRVNLSDPDLITADVQKAKEESDFVLVSMHWGEENTFDLSEEQVMYSELLTDLEVDVVLGGHSHNIQPIEWKEAPSGHETLVIYSLGNFVSSPYLDINSLGGGIEFDFVKEGDDLRVENVYFNPLVTHFDLSEPTNSLSRGNFKLYNLQDYTEDLARNHGLHGSGYPIDLNSYYSIVNNVIDQEFFKDDLIESIEEVTGSTPESGEDYNQDVAA